MEPRTPKNYEGCVSVLTPRPTEAVGTGLRIGHENVGGAEYNTTGLNRDTHTVYVSLGSQPCETVEGIQQQRGTGEQ